MQRKPHVGAGDRLHSLPYISGDGFRHIADIFVEDANDVSRIVTAVAKGGILAASFTYEEAVIVFFASHVLNELLAAGLLEKSVIDIVLVGHNSDNLGPDLDAPFLSHPRLRNFFTQNCQGENERMKCIPIGLPNRRWAHGAALAELTQSVRSSAAAALGGKSTFQPLNGQACFDITHAERAPIMKLVTLENPLWVNTKCSRVPAEYYNSILDVDAVFSPRGNGLDAHRSWEALVLGRLIITRHSSLDPLWRESSKVLPHWSLPVLLIENWPQVNASITKAALCEKIPSSARLHATTRLFFPFWACAIGSAAGRADEFCSTEALLKILSS